SDYSQLAGLILHIVPTQAILGFLFSPERLAIEKELRFITRGINMDGCNFTFAPRPGPMRQDVRHRQFGTPARLVKVESIFRKSGKIKNTEIRTARWDFDFSQFLKLLFHPRLVGCVLKVE